MTYGALARPAAAAPCLCKVSACILEGCMYTPRDWAVEDATAGREQLEVCASWRIVTAGGLRRC